MLIRHSGADEAKRIRVDQMRGSDFYRRYIARFAEIAKSEGPSADWGGEVEAATRQLHSETMPMSRAPFRQLRDDIVRELESRAKSQPEGHAREVYSLAADLVRKL